MKWWNTLGKEERTMAMTSGANPMICAVQLKQGDNVLIHVEGVVEKEGDLESIITTELFNEYRKQYPNQSWLDLRPPPQIYAFEKI